MDNNFNWWKKAEQKLRDWNVGVWGVNPVGVGRIAKSIYEGKGYGGVDDNWYSASGDQITPDPYTMNEVYDPRGVRYVFVRGQWQEDDPYAQRAFQNPLTGVVMYAAAPFPLSKSLYSSGKFYQTGADKVIRRLLGPGGRWAARNLPVGLTGWATNVAAGKLQPDAELYFRQLPTGEYVKGWDGKGGYSELVKPGTWRWIIERWGDNPPQDVVDEYMRSVGIDDGIYDATPQEAAMLNNPDQTPANMLLNLRSNMEPENALVKFSGPRQYAITLPGEGDRWKYVIQKDAEGNWVKVYRRTWGAKKEKELKKKAKGKG